MTNTVLKDARNVRADTELLPAPADAIEFLDALHKREGKLIPPPRLCAIDQSGGAPHALYVFGGAQRKENLTGYLGRNRRQNVYVHANAVRDIGDAPKANAGDITHILALPIDFDAEGQETAEEAKARAHDLLTRLGAAGFAPDIIVDSGGGVHAYYLAGGFAATDEVKARHRTAVGNVAAALGSDPAVKDAPRILRVPGSVNNPNDAKIKKGRRAAPAKLISCQRYEASRRSVETIEEFEALAGRIVAWAADNVALPEATGTRARVANDIGIAEERAVFEIEPEYPAEVVLSALRAVPNTEATLPTRENFVRVVASVKAGLGRRSEDFRAEVTAWATADGWADVDYFDKVWCSLTHVRADVRALFGRARRSGWNEDARHDFTALPEEELREIAEGEAEHKERVTSEEAIERALEEMNRRCAVVSLGKDVVIGYTDTNGMLEALRRVDSFHTLEKPRRVAVQEGKRCVAKQVSHLWLGWTGRREFLGGVAMLPRAIDGSGPPIPRGVLNTWRGFSTTPGESGDENEWPTIRHYLLDVICAGDSGLAEWLLNWLAQLVQRPFEKSGTALVLKGRQGSGKTTFATFLKGILDAGHVVMVDDERGLVGSFNAHIADALAIVSNEAFFGRDPKVNDKLKAFVTDETHRVERKGIDAAVVPSFVRLIVTTNHDAPVNMGADDRRWAIFDVSDVHARDADFFRDLRTACASNSPEMKGLLAHLLARKIDENALRNPPVTAGLIEVTCDSLTGAARWLYERLTDCEPAAPGDTAIASGFTTDFDDCPVWPERMRKNALRTDYGTWAKQQGWRVTANDREFSGALTKAFGKAADERPEIEGQRVRVVRLGALADARKAFAREYLRGHDFPVRASDRGGGHASG